MSLVKGVVKFFIADKGFGFIWPMSEMSKDEGLPRNDPGAREEIFFHATAVQPSPNHDDVVLSSGDEVMFEIAESDRGHNAVNISRVKTARDRNRVSLPATSATCGVSKADVPILISVFTDMTTGANAKQFQSSELEALKRHLNALENIHRKMDSSSHQKNSKGGNSAQAAS